MTAPPVRVLWTRRRSNRSLLTKPEPGVSRGIPPTARSSVLQALTRVLQHGQFLCIAASSRFTRRNDDSTATQKESLL